MTALAIALVRTWTRIYTWGMPDRPRAARLAEIESDLWESQHEAEPGSWPALRIILRLGLGAFDDLVWRVSFDLMQPGGSWRMLTAGAVVAATASVISVAAWVTMVMWPAPLPKVPDMMVFVAAPPPPPPPPPIVRPPCAPPDLTIGCR